ncbi:MAG: response regulator [Oscillospiraceae bacterium]|nr:response regulator [Oscillospiraceae bacterium]
MITVLMTIQILCTLAALVYIIYILTNESSRRYSLLTAAVMSSFAGSLGYIMTLLCNNTDAALAVTSFGIMGAAFSHYLIYSFCMDCCGIKKLNVLSTILLAANIIGIAMAVLTGKTGLFYKSFERCGGDIFFVPKTQYGLGAYIITAAMVVQSAVIAAATVYVFKKHGMQGGRHMPEMCAAAILPAAAKVAASMGMLDSFDLSYVLIVIGCLLISANVYNSKVMEVVNSARDNIIETMNDALLVTDTKMNIVDANPAARRIFPDLFKAGRKTQGMVSLIADLMDEEIDRSEFEINGKCYDKHISKLSNSDGSPMGYAVLLLDVTDTKRYVDDLIDMRQRADMANSAKSDFLANMSHEIRTPMNAIAGFAELCLREKNYQYAADIKAAAKNLIAIINDILDISKIESGKLELVPSVYSVEDMLNDVISLVYVQLDGKSGIEFKIDIDKRLPKKMYGDEVRIKQILINLLGNSVKFTKEGHIGLSVREISRNGDMSDIMIKVTDTGIGIKREDISKLFSNFQQVDTKKNREIEGTGLGLSITKNLVEMMNGTITVNSDYGKGSTFTVVLRQKVADSSYISVAAAKAAPANEEKSTVLYAPDAKVLIVDDNKVNLKVAAQLLSQYGIKCSTADSGKKAVQMVRSGYYDLVFMDHMMPEMDGVDTTKMIRSQGDAYSKGLPIIALTANAVSGAKEMFLESGLNDFISKPIQLPQLEKILAKWLPAKLVSYVGAKKSSASYNDSLELLGIIEETPKPEENSEQIDEFLIQGVDVKAGLELCGGNSDAYIAVMKTFVETAEESILRIETYAQSRNYKDYTTEVHGLKSSSLSIGAKELSEMARQLEAAGRREDYKQIMYDTPTLIARYTDIVEHIRPFVETEKHSGASEAGKPPVDSEVLKAKLGEVLEAIDNLDSPEAIKILDELLEFSFPTEKISEEMENARRYVDNFAYEKAEAAVRHVLEII